MRRPWLERALRTAWEKGYLSDSRSLADYRVAHINVGWEVPGLNRVAMELGGLSLTTVEAVYEKGTLRLPSPLPLPEQAHVWVTIQTGGAQGPEAERTAWLKLSEEDLTSAWDNSEDDVFNELLTK